MGLTFCNAYPTTITTCISFWDLDECGPEGNGWHNIGWYWVDPGTCWVVYENDLDFNRYWYYYAEAMDGSAVWRGDFPTRVLNEAFNHCDAPATTEQFSLGFRERDVGDNANFTVTFR